MTRMLKEHSCILIGGTSHTGKTTLGRRLAGELEWEFMSTDKLGRHPGRAWPKLRPEIADFYTNLSSETIYWLLQAHHENLQKLIEITLIKKMEAGIGLIIEGSALRPQYIAPSFLKKGNFICLHASEAFLTDRMHEESKFWTCEPNIRLIYERFIERSLRDNGQIVSAAQEHGIRMCNVSEPEELRDIWTTLVSQASPQAFKQQVL